MNSPQNSLHVGIDITSIMYHRGVSRYTSNLVRALAQLQQLELWLYGTSWRQHAELLAAAQELLPNNTQHHLKINQLPPSLVQRLWQFRLWPIAKILPECQVFHSWDWYQPPDRQMPLVTTIHDVAMLRYPQAAHPKILAAHQRSWKRIRAQSTIQVIAVSQATKRDVVELLHIDPSRVTVIYEALPQESVLTAQQLTPQTMDGITAELQLLRPYILFVGTREPRKNLSHLIQAWQPLAADVDLLVAGAVGWDDSETMAASSGPKPRFLGQVSNLQLAALYRQAQVLAYPSRYEGFGLPILEAFHHGTPVVTSNTSSLPEVAGNAAELVDPDSIEDIRRGLSTVLNYSPTQLRTKRQQMKLRLQLFDWQQTAEQTLKVYHKAVAETGQSV